MILGEGVDKAASRKYRRRMLLALVAYIGLFCVSAIWLERHPPAPEKYAIAVLPMLAVFVVPALVVQLLHSLDELQRKIQLESLGFAFAATAISSLTYGFLENAGLPHLNWIWVWPIMAAFWILGVFAARWRYR
ncbi:MAG: hypothetical protein J2P13_07220 [Acidobacteria bacterium]|nr:hypothetical protein [Acidobacteriota bacterium]